MPWICGAVVCRGVSSHEFCGARGEGAQHALTACPVDTHVSALSIGDKNRLQHDKENFQANLERVSASPVPLIGHTPAQPLVP